MRLQPDALHGISAAAFWAVSLASTSVRAFSDPASFAAAPLAAGGGGRFFTGSPADGFTCKVCHEGGANPKVSLSGLPLDGYQSGVRYEISVSWPEATDRIAAALELTDAQGNRAGTVQLPPEGEAVGPEFCAPVTDGVLAASISEAPNLREVINLPDCGATRVRFLWTAPSTDMGPVWFSGSSVWSDGEADPYNDGATDFARVLASPPLTSVATQSCSVSRAQGTQRFTWLWCWTGLIALLYRVRRRRE